MIFENDGLFVLKDVQGCSADFLAFQTVQQVVGVDDFAAARVDDENALEKYLDALAG